MSIRQELKKIWEDTEQQMKENPVLQDAVEKSIREQQFYYQRNPHETDCFRPSPLVFEGEEEIIVTKNRTFRAVSNYRGYKTAVLNFASAGNPGGGVKNGAGAQEECLCRCSTLYPCLNTKQAWDNFYNPHRKASNPLHNNDIIYTPNVVVFKSDTTLPVMMEEADWYKTDVITCAAPNLKGRIPVSITDRELLELQKDRISRILDAALIHDREVLILGAFGCGAFGNRPEIVAEAFREVLKQYKHAFRIIEFAVFCRGDDTYNYRVFSNKFRK